ncbi:MAG: hypothetical protein KDB02_04505 [Acidimicrobiales bacterium]|nr:hypothetical protein [Acidimicrobiales bacterium]
MTGNDQWRERVAEERGAIGGLEVLPFGLLIFVVGMLLVLNAWAVVDAKLTAEAAAREAGRAYAESASGPAAAEAARQAAAEAVSGAGRDPGRLRVSGESAAFVRCAVVTVRTSYEVPALTLPFIGGFGDGIDVHGEHRERIDAFRAGLGPEQNCG